MGIPHIHKERREHLIQVKVNDKELKAIHKNAERWADSNVSDWVRYATIVLKPKPEHLRAAQEQHAAESEG